ncbi:hypothetical protein ACI3ET_06030 [Ornithinimicrobium sp. LYQ121]|uniref:Agd3-related carbohydrate-binding protein n=1 Tax=Ornithinimicrobium sp. LYQ121 TaxID=3378801 RepID=UPI00385369F2
MPSPLRRLLLAPLALCLPLALLQPTAGAADDPLPPDPLSVPAPVEPPTVEDIPDPLGVKGGSVRRFRATTDAELSAGARATARAGATADATLTAAVAVVPSRPVALRALVLAVDDDDLALPPWRATLDRVGAAYDVVHVAQTPLTRDLLVGPDGVGRYNAVLLSSTGLLHPAADGSWVSGLDSAEWNTLWDYEREYAVRQATLFGSYGTWPEETCLRTAGEGGVDESGITATLTPEGAAIFDYLNPAAQVPVQLSWVYRNQIAPGCAAQPVLVSGGDVLGATSTTPDGREQMALSFSSNEHLLQSHLLTYGLFRWASRGMFLGEQRHFLKLDIDDYFNSSDLMLEDLTLDPDGFRMTGDDALNVKVQQDLLRAEHPVASDFRLTLAYNGEGVNTSTAASCTGGGEGELVAASLCVKNDVEWLNHTFSHLKLNFSDFRSTRLEITRNRQVSKALGLAAPNAVLKTGEYSGLGVYHPDPTNDIDPPTDHGLMASNPALIEAAVATGATYLHGNMSFPSHVPDCFNCNIAHPMDPRVKVVPDWPTNIAYFSATPAQETAFYNWFYGPDGRFPYWSVDQTYDQVIDHESTGVLHRVAMGSIYSNTMHIPNLSDYGGGRTLAFDWAGAVVGKYESYYSVPLLSPTWPVLAQTTSVRNGHYAIKDQVQATWIPAAGAVRITSTTAGQLQVTGMQAPKRTTYGSSMISTVTLKAGATTAWAARPLP